MDDELIAAAMEQFGRKGFEGTSTRAIAAAAGKPMSAITYHFGGKQGLYLAVARHIAELLRSSLPKAVIEARPTDLATMDAQMVERAFDDLLEAGVAIATDSRLDAAALFVTREQAEPTEAFSILYENVMEPLLLRLTALSRKAAGPSASDEQIRLRVTMLVGQILMFRFCRAAALRFMGWGGMAQTETVQIIAGARATLRAMLNELSNGVPA